MKFRSIWGLIAKSPFTAFVELADKVEACCVLMPDLLDAFYADDEAKVAMLAERISHLEHEADVTKTQARDNLPSSLLMPVDRRDALDVLASLDAIADCVEDVAILFTLRKMEAHEGLITPLKLLVDRVMDTVIKALAIVRELEVASRSSFSPKQTDRIRGLIDELGRLEHEADVAQDAFAKALFGMEDDIKPGSLMMWGKIANKIGDVANHAEKTGNRLRLFFAQ